MLDAGCWMLHLRQGFDERSGWDAIPKQALSIIHIHILRDGIPLHLSGYWLLVTGYWLPSPQGCQG